MLHSTCFDLHKPASTSGLDGTSDECTVRSCRKSPKRDGARHHAWHGTLLAKLGLYIAVKSRAGRTRCRADCPGHRLGGEARKAKSLRRRGSLPEMSGAVNRLRCVSSYVNERRRR
jgi:hypothetical protein